MFEYLLSSSTQPVQLPRLTRTASRRPVFLHAQQVAQHAEVVRHSVADAKLSAILRPLLDVAALLGDRPGLVHHLDEVILARPRSFPQSCGLADVARDMVLIMELARELLDVGLDHWRGLRRTSTTTLG